MNQNINHHLSMPNERAKQQRPTIVTFSGNFITFSKKQLSPKKVKKTTIQILSNNQKNNTFKVPSK